MKLSKSKFVAGCQCLKRLYLQVHEPELAAEPDAGVEAIIEQGREVGMLARQLFPGGIEVWSDSGLDRATRVTRELVANPGVPAIFEAVFERENVLVKGDDRAAAPDVSTIDRSLDSGSCLNSQAGISALIRILPLFAFSIPSQRLAPSDRVAECSSSPKIVDWFGLYQYREFLENRRKSRAFAFQHASLSVAGRFEPEFPMWTPSSRFLILV